MIFRQNLQRNHKNEGIQAADYRKYRRPDARHVHRRLFRQLALRHEEYEGDVQDVFAQAFKGYVEDNSDHTVQVYRFGELGESDDIMEQTQNGILQFVNQSPGFTGSLIPRLRSSSSPI
ncbi:hypothetical protein A8U91_04599 [Halomonas elongata]|uniref:Uncharacterized protein n=1 Tax=Halomonas elongata TaxID=2746 RepID=A0A1B8NZT9_HALEL|nr:hypothetical protein A8U91_04599 [Halomonas elongata]